MTVTHIFDTRSRCCRGLCHIISGIKCMLTTRPYNIGDLRHTRYGQNPCISGYNPSTCARIFKVRLKNVLISACVSSTESHYNGGMTQCVWTHDLAVFISASKAPYMSSGGHQLCTLDAGLITVLTHGSPYSNSPVRFPRGAYRLRHA